MDFEGTKAWCTTGVGVLDFDVKMRDYLRANDFVYPVVSRLGETPEQMAMHVHDVSTLRDMILSFENPAAAVRLLASPSTKIVSLTITEFGYRVPINEGDRALVRAALEGATDAEGPEGDARVAEAAPETRGATVFGIVLAALASRRRRGLRPFTIMSCDNLPHNGEVAKRRVLGAAADLDLCAETQRWLEEEARFPSTMVDRITPATSPGDLASLKAAAGVDDAWPVMCEPYKHWVIEDDFVDGERPAWERVGAVLVPDVRPHELMKVRLLNVGHSAMCYAGVLAGCEHVHEAVTHKLIRPFLKRLMREEIAASLRADPSMEALVPGLDAYADLVLSRFKNVAVKDTLMRIAMDGSEKFRVQGRAVVMEGLAAERTVRGFALYVAAWAHFLRKSIMQDVPVRDASAALVSAPWAWARSADVAAADVAAEGAVGAVAPPPPPSRRRARRTPRPCRRSWTSRRCSACWRSTRAGARLWRASSRTSPRAGWRRRCSGTSSASGTTRTATSPPRTSPRARVCPSASAGRSSWTRCAPPRVPCRTSWMRRWRSSACTEGALTFCASAYSTRERRPGV